ncbi:amidohydrolase family protein [bacterium]|nr:amidohydrolase family protein [bacterium]
MTIYLKDASFIDWQTMVFQKVHLAVSPGVNQPVTVIDSIPTEPDAHSGDLILDCDGKLVTRSFGCGHHHIYSTLARGMPAPARSPRNFQEILQFVWWHLDKNLDLEMIRASALASALHCARNGVTFVIDHHASPFAVENSLQTIRDAFDLVGVSHLLCYEMSDRDGESVTEKALAETEAYLKEGNQGLVGLHASFTVGDTLLRKAADLAVKYRTGIHVHVAEDRSDQEHCLKTYNQRVIHRFNEMGLLDHPRTILAHCLHLDREEKGILAASRAWVAENVESNLNNNVGLTDYRDYGPRIMLGTDGMHSDMLRSAKAAFFVGQGTEAIGFPDIYQRFRNIHHYLAANQIRGDGDNNLVILDYDSPTEIHGENFLGHFVFGIDSRHVESVIANGELIVQNRELQTMDEDEILTFAREMGSALWRKLQA